MGAFVSIAEILPALGDAITVTRPSPDIDAVNATGIWLPADALTDSDPMGAGDFVRWDARRLMVIPLTAQLPTVPKGSQIVAISEDGSGPFTWTVDGFGGPREADAVTVILKRASS